MRSVAALKTRYNVITIYRNNEEAAQNYEL